MRPRSVVLILLGAAAIGACVDESPLDPGAAPPDVQPAGALWYAGPALCGLTQAQLGRSGKINPAILVSSPSLAGFSDVALDSSGNLWAVGGSSDQVFRFPAAAVARSGSAQPDLILRSDALAGPGNLAFDAGGALWVANRRTPDASGGGSDNGSLVRFDELRGLSGMQQLAPSATLTTPDPRDLYQLGAIAFDAAENLWVTSFTGLLRFDRPRAQVGTAVAAPAAVIEKKGYPNNLYFYSIGFDAAGALWAASGDGLHFLTSITKFANPAGLNGRSSPPPAATIVGQEDVLPAGGLTFDGAGDLWMATGQSILMYAGPGGLGGEVRPVPAISLEVDFRAAPSTNAHLILSRADHKEGGDR